MFTSAGERHTWDHLIVTNDQKGSKKKQQKKTPGSSWEALQT